MLVRQPFGPSMRSVRLYRAKNGWDATRVTVTRVPADGISAVAGCGVSLRQPASDSSRKIPKAARQEKLGLVPMRFERHSRFKRKHRLDSSSMFKPDLHMQN